MENSFVEVEGNLLTMFAAGEFDVIAHGCNCFRNMGAGIALSIAKTYPAAFRADMTTAHGDSSKLGSYTLAEVEEGVIANIYSQYAPGRDLRLPKMINALEKLNEEFKGKHIGLPLIGCGLAGGDWKEVGPKIQQALKDCRVTIVHFKN